MIKIDRVCWKLCQLSKFRNRIWSCTAFERRLFHTCSGAHAPANNKTMSKQKVYVTRSDVPAIGLQLLRERYDVTVWGEQTPVPREELLQQVRGKDALFCLLTDKIDKELLEAAGPSLKVVATMSVGFDHVDVPALASCGVQLGITPDVLTDAVAELTVALLLATTRRLFEAHDQIVKGAWGAWSPGWMCGRGVANSTVGIVGYGRIGREVAARLAAFKPAAILHASRSVPGGVPLDELLARSDFVIATCALVDETRNLFDAAAFRRMKRSAVFVNTSRGGVVDQEALLAALESGEILAAGLDVMVPEPLPPGHPLLGRPNCVLLPHIGSATQEARAAMAELTARNIVAALEGNPLPAPGPVSAK